MENKDKAKEELFRKNWDNDSCTVVKQIEKEKRTGIFINMVVCETSFKVEFDSEKVFDRIEELNQNELEGVFIYDYTENTIIFRSVNHYKTSIFEDPLKFEAYITKSKSHCLAKTKFLSTNTFN